MNILNLTPHAITLRHADGTEVTYPPSGHVALVTAVETPTGDVIGGVPVVRRTYGRVAMPLIPDGAIAIVSSMCLDAMSASKHPDLGIVFAPDTGATAIRENGQVRAVTRLVAGTVPTTGPHWVGMASDGSAMPYEVQLLHSEAEADAWVRGGVGRHVYVLRDGGHTP